MSYAKIQLRRGTAAEWYDANPVLLDGESGFERDTQIFKVGDGVTAWRDLPATNTQYLPRNEYIPGASMLSQLSDVAIAGATIDQVLTYDGTAWIPSTPAPSGGGASFGMAHLESSSVFLGSGGKQALFTGFVINSSAVNGFAGISVVKDTGDGSTFAPVEAGLYSMSVETYLYFASAPSSDLEVQYNFTGNSVSSNFRSFRKANAAFQFHDFATTHPFVLKAAADYVDLPLTVSVYAEDRSVLPTISSTKYCEIWLTKHA